MMRLLRAELMKLSTVRTPKILLVVAALIAIMAAGAQILAIELRDGDPTLSSDQVALLLAGAAPAIPMALFIGAIGATGEVRHRTEYLNHLITPTRWQQAVARLGAYFLFGLTFALVLLGPLLATVLGWALIRVGEVPWGATPNRIVFGIILATAAYTVIGLAVGAILRNQILAVGLLAAWMFVIEGFFVLLVGLIDLRWSSLFPVQAIQALLIDDAFDEGLAEAGLGGIAFGVWTTAGIIAAWTIGLSAIGMWRTLNSDIR